MPEWRVIPSFPAYEASDEGEVRRGEPYFISRSTTILKPTVARHGYQYVCVRKETGQFISRTVHSLVCETFHGLQPSPEHEVAHRDGVKSNNHADNLRWATPLENAADSIRLGVLKNGEAHHNVILTQKQVEEIRAAWPLLIRNINGRIKRGEVFRLAKKIGAHRRTVYSVGRWETWTNV